MGGKNLVRTVSKPLTLNELLRVHREIQSLLRHLFIFDSVPAHRRLVHAKKDIGKTTYSDVDLYICGKSLPPGWASHIADKIGSKEFIYNAATQPNPKTPAFFEYNGYEVEIKPTFNEAFSAEYYSYGGLGSVVAPIFKGLGVTLLEDGLRMPIKDGETFVKNYDYHDNLGVNIHSSFLLSSVLSPLLGVSPWLCLGMAVMNSAEEVYTEIEKSQYFDLALYDPTREPSTLYTGFINYLKQKHSLTDESWPQETKASFRKLVLDLKEYGPTPISALLRLQVGKKYDPKSGIVPALTEASAEVQAAVIEQEVSTLLFSKRKSQAIASKFNGDRVMKVTGMNPGALMGVWLKEFKNSFKSDSKFETFILSSTQETINVKMLEFHKTMTQTKPQPIESPGPLELGAYPSDSKGSILFNNTGFKSF